jgi:hypothetical protein
MNMNLGGGTSSPLLILGKSIHTPKPNWGLAAPLSRR